jgi:soluble lytic murein transglycosylase-like protein
MPYLFLVALAGLVLVLVSRSAGAATRPSSAGASPAANLVSAWGRSMTWQPPAAAGPYRAAIAAAEAKNGLPANLLLRQLDVESDHFSPDVISGTRRSRAGAIGIAQFMPATAASKGLNASDPFASINQAAADMREMFNKFGSWSLALAAYNWGQGNLKRQGIGAAPAETRDYIARILGPIGLA